MIINKKQKLLVIVATIAAITTIFSLLSKRSPNKVSIVNSKPEEGATKILPTAQVVAAFNQPININLLSATSTPTENWTVKFGDTNKDVIIYPKEYLAPDTKYTLEISYDGQVVYTLNFKTIAQQGDPKYTQQVQRETMRDFPLSVNFPYETNLYRASYTAPLTITIRLKTTTLSQAQATAQVKSYINNKGGDASAHKYVVIPASPLPSPSIAPVTTQPDL